MFAAVSSRRWCRGFTASAWFFVSFLGLGLVPPAAEAGCPVLLAGHDEDDNDFAEG